MTTKLSEIEKQKAILEGMKTSFRQKSFTRPIKYLSEIISHCKLTLNRKDKSDLYTKLLDHYSWLDKIDKANA